MSYIYFFIASLDRNWNKNHLINLTHGCLIFRLRRWWCQGSVWFWFLIWYSMQHHYFEEAIALFPASWAGGTGQYSVSLIFLRCLWVQHGAPLFCSGHCTTISCSLGRQYGPVFSLIFLRCLLVQHAAPLFWRGHCTTISCSLGRRCRPVLSYLS
jgi:hypothetical protein